MAPPKDQDVSRLFQQALERHRAGDAPEAAELYRAVLAASPDHVPALSNLGAALRDLGRAAEALRCYDQALARRPDHAPTWNNRGVALIDLGHHDAALSSFDRALALQPAYPDALNNRGRALAGLGRTPGDAGTASAALAALDRALALDPGHAETWDNRGLLLFELGRFDEAAGAIGQAIRLSPTNVRFYYHLAELGRLEPGDPRFTALEALADDPDNLAPGEQILAHFALGAVYDRSGEPAAAFEHWRQGAELRRGQLAYDESAELQRLAHIRAAFSAEVMQAVRPGEPASPAPIFIVGMPRSGSTLVEQILASHPEVSAAGEADTFRRVLRKTDDEAPERAAGMSAAALEALGAEFLRLSPGPGRIVNKRLDNFELIGLILLALPHARIIHVRRDPRDVCLSCFSKLFGEELPQTFDLGELGRYYCAYDAVMAHWRRVLPTGSMIDVWYERLVKDPERQTRRMLAHCGLEWDPRCLDFHLTQRRISTASAIQVRRPLYADAVGRWRRYEPWLGPLFDALIL